LVTHNFVNIAFTPVLGLEIKSEHPNTPNEAEWRGFVSRTFLLVAGLTDLGGFGRYLGPKQGKQSVFNGSVR
jgi:hypothetical protein